MPGFEIFLFAVFMAVLAAVAWIGQWGRSNTVARYAVYAVIGLSGLALMGLGGLVLLTQPLVGEASQITAIGWVMLLMGAGAIPSLIPQVRHGLAKTIFPGLEVSAPVHTWSLYSFLAALVVTAVGVTMLFNPDVIAASLKSMPLMIAAGVNMLCFVLFSFVAAGIWIHKPFKATLVDLGLTRVSWKIAGLCVGIALLLALSIQGLESVLMQLISDDMRAALEKVVGAMKIEGGPGVVLLHAVLIGLAAGIGEEILFRGLMQPVFGLVPTTLLFTLVHMHYGPTVLLLELFLVGLLLGLIRKRFNTTAAIIVHAAFDFFALASSLF